MATNNKCSICGSTETDDIAFGEWKTLKNITVHYFCLLLSTGLPQNGGDNDGILGFLPTDIEKLMKRAKKVKCVFCHQTGASITCSHKSCKKSFHITCGEKLGCQYKFREDFKSFCPDHIDVIDELPHLPIRQCLICWDKMEKYKVLTSIPVCCNEYWMHRNCMRKMAITQGYFFKCPACGDRDKKARDKYREMVQIRGIFIPDQDAIWEQSQNAYQELLSKYKRCDATECLCEDEKGREYSQKKGKWKIIVCQYCGSQGTHMACRNGEYGYLICPTCQVQRQSQVQSQHQIQSQEFFSQPFGPSQSIAGPSSQCQRSQGLVRKINSVSDDEPKTKKKKKMTNEDKETFKKIPVDGFETKKFTYELASTGIEVPKEPLTRDEFMDGYLKLGTDRVAHFFQNGTDFRLGDDKISFK